VSEPGKMPDAKQRAGSPAKHPKKRRRPTWPQRILLVGWGFFLVLLIEGLVRLLGLAPSFKPEDPLMSGRAGRISYVKGRTPSGETAYICPWISPEYPYNYRPIPLAKAPGEIRIFVFGGSSAVGYPFDGRQAFPRYLEAGLGAVLPGRSVRVYNCAQNAIPAGTCLRLMNEMCAFEPDIFVVYTGNNEYDERHVYREIRLRGRVIGRIQSAARRSALYRCVEAVVLPAKARVYSRFIVSERGIRPPEYSAEERRLIRNNYIYVIERMMDLCRERGVGLVLCTVAANSASWPPYRSTFRPETSAEARTAWLAGFREALAAYERKAYPEALAALDRLAAVDDARADLHYLRGRVLTGLNRTAEAAKAFERALDLDNVCWRARPSHNAAIRDLARRDGVPVADIVAALREASPDGLLGEDFFWDHCHPRPVAHREIALAVARVLFSRDLLPDPPRGWENAFKKAVSAWDGAVTYSHTLEARAWRNVASGWMALWTHHRGPDDLLRDTPLYLRRALKYLDRAVEADATLSSAWFYRGVVLAQFGKLDEARENWRRAMGLEPPRSELRRVLEGLLEGRIPYDTAFERWIFVRNEMLRLAE